MAHEVSDFIDSIKESLTDAQYKEGMELCQQVFQKNEKEEKLYRMMYLRPYTFADNHCDDEDCVDTKFMIAFKKSTSLILLSDRRYERIVEESLFRGSKDELDQFIEHDILQAFPNDNQELGSEIEWFEFPVLKLERIH
jgi:hypothetical protein